MIIWISSFPRSGNTMTRIILKTFYNQNTYNIKPENKSLISDFIGHCQIKPINILKKHKENNIYFVKTHELPKSVKIKSIKAPAIYIVRDGRDVILSAAYHHLNCRNIKITKSNLNKLMKNFMSKWNNHIMKWYNYKPKVILKYENLLEHPKNNISYAINKLSLNIKIDKNAKMPSFEDLKKIKPKFFRKGVSGSWKDEMPKEIEELFWSKCSGAMEVLEYKRNQT